MTRKNATALFVGALALIAGACRGSPQGRTGGQADEKGRTTTGGERAVYVAVGASDAVGAGADNPSDEAWPVVLHRTSMPPGSRFVNVGVSGATVTEALQSALPRALAERPTVVTVWLNVNDALARVPPERFERQLGELVRALRRGGGTAVFVANTPRLDVLPAHVVDAYNAATARITEREGAVLVDLHAASVSAAEQGSLPALVSADGFHPSTAGHRAVAGVFAGAIRAAGGVRT